jgi:hypothetical protein
MLRRVQPPHKFVGKVPGGLAPGIDGGANLVGFKALSAELHRFRE